MRAHLRTPTGALPAIAAVLVCGALVTPMLAVADDDEHYQNDDHDRNLEAPLIRRGFEIAPVPLNLAGKNAKLNTAS